MDDIGSLIQRWQEGDERAAEILYNTYRDSTFRLAFGLLGNAEDAEEVAQDALAYALINIHRYNPARASFSTWLHIITVSRCRDRQRRKRPLRLSLAEWLGWEQDIPAPNPTPEHQTIQAETRDQVLEAVQALSPRLREAIILRYWGNHTYREMAKILNCPLPTAQSRVRLGYKYLRQNLEQAESPSLSEGFFLSEKEV